MDGFAKSDEKYRKKDAEYFNYLMRNDCKTGLVFGGGGAKGSYEIGVWMAIRDLEIDNDITGVSGTSIGALNMALYAQGDVEEAQHIWLNLKTRDIVKIDMKKIGGMLVAALSTYLEPRIAVYMAHNMMPEMLFQSGLLTRKSLQRILEEAVDDFKIINSPLELYACCCRAGSMEAEYFLLNNITYPPVKTVLTASAAIPVAFDAVEINGFHYFDGGLRDNVPVKPLYDNGFRRIIAVSTDPGYHIRKEKFPDATLWLICPSRSSLFTKGIGEVLDFDPAAAYRRMCVGYHDAVKVLCDYPAICRENLFGKQIENIPFVLGQTLKLKNGLDITVHKAAFHRIQGQKYALFDVSVCMTERLVAEHECFMTVSTLLLAFPDGRRSYMNMNVESDGMYRFPQPLKKNCPFRGQMAFTVPEDAYREFLLVVRDLQNGISVGKDYFICIQNEEIFNKASIDMH